MEFFVSSKIIARRILRWSLRRSSRKLETIVNEESLKQENLGKTIREEKGNHKKKGALIDYKYDDFTIDFYI